MDIENFEYFISEKNNSKDAEKMWDKRSSVFFERTEKIQKEFSQEFVFDIIHEKKLLNEHSKVLDIGCGTGRHLLEFAHYTPYLHGTDISSEMLAYAKNKLKAYPEANFFHGNWLEIFKKEKQYDFVFACMTPAISSIEHLKRMCYISKKYCMLERFIYQKDNVQEQIEAILNRPYIHAPHNRKNWFYGAWNIVWNLGFYPEVFFEDKTHSVENKIDEYMEYFEGSEKEKNDIFNLLQRLAVNDIITANERVIKGVMLWKVL